MDGLKVLQTTGMSMPGQQPLVDQEDGNKEPYILNLALTLTSSVTLGKSLNLSERASLG